MLSNLRKCPLCDRWTQRITTQQRFTAYAEERLNWLTCCEQCHADDDAYYIELWADYHQSRL